MAPSLGTQIFWMISIGMVIGYVGHFIYRGKGIDLMPSVITATAAAVITGLVAMYFEFSVILGFSWLGGITVLFLTNVFQQEGEEEMAEYASS